MLIVEQFNIFIMVIMLKHFLFIAFYDLLLSFYHLIHCFDITFINAYNTIRIENSIDVNAIYL